MITLPREPWHGGQICGEQLEYGVVPGRSVYCGEFKKLGSPACEEHDRELREDNYGVLPEFAEGNALGVEIVRYERGWCVHDVYGALIAGADHRDTLEYMHGFTLSWEPYEGDTPVEPTPEELAAYTAQLRTEA